MNKYKLIQFYYPGMFFIKPNVWIRFDEKIGKFAFLIVQTKKGLSIHDPHNEIIKKDKKYSIKSIIGSPRGPNYILTPQGKNDKILFHSITEENPDHSRSYIDKPYTDMYLLIDGNPNVTGLEFFKPYLTSLFIRYNSTIIQSPILKPSEEYWQESVSFLQSEFEHESTFDEIAKSDISHWNLPFRRIAMFLGVSKYGVYPKRICSSQRIKN
ncbi:hypothetical protein GCM10009122_56290 [Fulvivirga kasyanovii]|uniref:hypothetical protein n=1 Tax=Fulvivirga kasyanovii TaxID=396812 RepID=UPI0031D46DD6